MSLILDALNKADQERSETHEVPNLRAVHGSPYPQSRPGFFLRWRVEIVFIAALLLAYLCYQLYVGRDPSSSSIQPGLQPPPAMAATQAAAPPAAAARLLSRGDTVGVPAPVAPAATATPGAQPDTHSPAKPSLEAQLNVRSLYAQQHKAARAPDNEVPAAALALSQAAQSTSAAPGSAARLAKLPMLSELSAQKQRAIPSIDYSLHVYSIERDTGFVTLNGQRRRMGDQVAPGLRLENIAEDFIVLSYQGSKFRLLSLNSWINLQ